MILDCTSQAQRRSKGENSFFESTIDNVVKEKDDPVINSEGIIRNAEKNIGHYTILDVKEDN